MKLTHCIMIQSPMGQQVIPQAIPNEQLDGFIQNLAAQGVDPRNIKIRTDIELEEGEYEIVNLDDKKN